ncbi:protein NRT1/ PTR FAMILY 5.5-like [Coffea eugenioides]|uniref:protein NRT1/ PTR FAMILY 5.5-like n=1 Tax=Coffea eugenioides TaxID=49369 RepID=UPI000F6111C0|nr:protein NRT1/ PTR FAMILY 5.5-like [Coffea eugenioides]
MAFLRIMVLLWADMLATYVMWIMQKYLTDVWKLGVTHAAGIMNVYTGLTKFLPLVFFIFVDAGLGNYRSLLLSSIAFSIGMGFLSMSTPPVLHKVTGTCKDYEPNCLGHTQKALFYTALALIAAGLSVRVVSLVAFAENQIEKNPDEPKENEPNCKSSSMSLDRKGHDGKLINKPSLRLPSFKAKKPSLRLPSFMVKNPEREQQQQTESTKKAEVDLSQLQFQPLEAMLALAQKDSGKLPGACCILLVPVVGLIALPYIKPWSIRFGIPAICTLVATLAFVQGTRSCNKEENRPAEGSTVTEVEETKIIIRMIPIWITFVICGVITSVGNTYFVEQASHMNYKIGKLKLPDSVILVFYGISKLQIKSIYDAIGRYLKGARKEKYAPSIGIALATIFSVLCCITAAGVETRRIHVIRSHGLLDKPDDKIPLSALVLLPQYFFLAGLDSFFENSVTPFLTDQSPPSMKKHLVYLSPGLSGLGTVGSVLSVYVVGKISESRGKPNWFQYTLNQSRLDRYYWVLAVLSAANFLWFAFWAKLFPLREPGSNDKKETGNDEEKAGNGELSESIVGFVTDGVLANFTHSDKA